MNEAVSKVGIVHECELSSMSSPQQVQVRVWVVWGRQLDMNEPEVVRTYCYKYKYSHRTTIHTNLDDCYVTPDSYQLETPG